MTGFDAAFRRIKRGERMLEAVVRRRVERAVFSAFGVKPFWWSEFRG